MIQEKSLSTGVTTEIFLRSVMAAGKFHSLSNIMKGWQFGTWITPNSECHKYTICTLIRLNGDRSPLNILIGSFTIFILPMVHLLTFPIGSRVSKNFRRAKNQRALI